MRSVAESIILGTLFPIGKRLICLVDLLELFFIASLFVGMVLMGKLPVGFFYVVIGSILLDAEYFVIIVAHVFLSFHFLSPIATLLSTGFLWKHARNQERSMSHTRPMQAVPQECE